MKNITKIAIAVLGFAPIALVLAFWTKLPEQVPTHWDLNGTVNGYGSKLTLLMLAGLGLFVAAVMLITRRIDPKKENYNRFSQAYIGFLLFMELFMLLMVMLVLTEALHPGTLDVGKAVTMVVGLLFAFCGNLMPKMKSNYFMGIKTPWTLASETVWYKTHRLGGGIWFVGGVLLALSAFLPESIRSVVMVVIVCVICLVPIAASYVYFVQEKKSS